MSTESPQTKVLASTVLSLTDDKYSRGYNLLNSLPHSVTVDAFCFSEDHDLTHPYITPHPITGNIIKRTVNQIQAVHKELQTEDYDIYHRFNLMYGGWNPFLQTGKLETPTVVGPVEPHHNFRYNQFKRIVLDGLNVDFGETVNRTLYNLLMKSKDGIDLVRIPMFKRTLENADRVVVVNESTKEFYSKYVNSTSHFRVVPIGTRVDEFIYNPAVDSKNIIYVGNMTERKHPMDAVKAMRLILKEHPDSQLHLVGSGPKEEECKQLARELEIEESVTVHGFVEFKELQLLLRDSRLFIHPSHSDSYFHSRLEAMASGCVVIGTDLLGADDIITHGTNGYLYPVGDAEKLASLAKKPLSDKELSTSISKDARQYIEDNHRWEDIAAQYVEIYSKIK
jgi:glycosyltransferase involved in cell wall biosynthesis